MIRIAIAEVITKIGETLKEKIELAPDFQVAFIAKNGEEMILQLKEKEIDIILMDINMAEMNGNDDIKAICSNWPYIKIVMSIVFDEEHCIFDSLLAGSIGVIRKDDPPAKIHRGLYEVLEGGTPMSKNTAKKTLDWLKNHQTQQNKTLKIPQYLKLEIEILEHLALGKSYEQIANKLNISYYNVKTTLEKTSKKLQEANK